MGAILLTVTVVWATRDAQEVVPLVLSEGATVGDAIAGSGLVDRHRIDRSAVRVGIHGRLVRENTVLANGDRVEICRPLVADPKESRRARAGARKPVASKRRGGR